MEEHGGQAERHAGRTRTLSVTAHIRDLQIRSVRITAITAAKCFPPPEAISEAAGKTSEACRQSWQIYFLRRDSAPTVS